MDKRRQSLKPISYELSYNPPSKREILTNLFLVSIVFMLEGTAFSLRLVESSVHRRKGTGTHAVASIFVGTMASCVISPAIIQLLGLKRTFALGWLTFCIFTLANFFSKMYILIPTGLLAGFMLGPVLTSQGTYVTTLAAEYAAIINTREWMSIISIFNGIFFTLFQSAQIWGSLLASLMLSHSYGTIANATINCGASYCPADFKDKVNYLEDKWQGDIQGLMGVYLAFGLLGLLASLLCLADLQPLYRHTERNFFSQACGTMLGLKNRRLALLIPIFIYSGVQQAIIYGTFGEAYMTCALGLHHLGYGIMCVSSTGTVFSLILSVFVKCTGQVPLFVFAALLQLNLLGTMLLWQPTSNDLSTYFVIFGFWGIGEAIWSTQISTLLGYLFQEDLEIAFANFRLYQSVGIAVTLLMSPYVCVYVRLIAAIVVLVVAMVFYLSVEIIVRLSGADQSEAQIKINAVMPTGSTWIPLLKPYGVPVGVKPIP